MKHAITALTALLLLTGTVSAQFGRGTGMARGRGMAARGAGAGVRFMDITEEQQQQIDKLCLTHYKEIDPLLDSAAEMNLKLRSLRRAEKIDSKAIDKLIGDIGAVNTDLARKKEAHRQNIRKLLTEEQRLSYDSMYGAGAGMGMRRGGMMGRGGMRAGCGMTGRAGMMGRGGMMGGAGRGMRGGGYRTY